MASYNQRQQQQQMRQPVVPASPYPVPGGAATPPASIPHPSAPTQKPAQSDAQKPDAPTDAFALRTTLGRKVKEVMREELKGFIERPVYANNGAGCTMHYFEFDPDTGKVGDEVVFKGEY